MSGAGRFPRPAGASAPGAADRVRPADIGLACGLALLAGATDAYGFMALKGLFVSFMSGNTTLLGIALAGGDDARIGSLAVLVGCFVAGAALGAVLEVLAGRWVTPSVTGTCALLLAVPMAWPGIGPAALAAAMGTLNAAITRLAGVTVSITYVTGTLVRFGQGLGRALCRQPDGWAFLWQLPTWCSLLAGAVLGALAAPATGVDAPWPLPAYAALLTVLALALRPSGSAPASRHAGGR